MEQWPTKITAEVLAGHAHLFAPARPRNICFWIERTGLGRLQGGGATREILEPLSSFWSINSDIDIWFGPAFGSKSTHFTGGIVTALRQGSCDSGTSQQIE